MQLTKSPTNNCIVAKLQNVRKHPNADRLQLADVLGTQVIVGLEAKNDDTVLYFDSNLCLSYVYLHFNNLFAKAEQNFDITKKGYFSDNGRVRAQRLRGEVSNGFVAELHTVLFDEISRECDWEELTNTLTVGTEFTHINGVEICSKYITPIQINGVHAAGTRGKNKKKKLEICQTFYPHWDTPQLMRNKRLLCYTALWIEEKVHGTSGRTGYLEFSVPRKWYQFWKPKTHKEYRYISGTRRLDSIHGHIHATRQRIHDSLVGKLHPGETVYYEIFGRDVSGKEIQKDFDYGCVGGEYKVMLYRVTITTPDGYSVDLPRPMVYKRAGELGMIAPPLLYHTSSVEDKLDELEAIVKQLTVGSSVFANHMKEGVVVWFMDESGCWQNLKHKSEEFLIKECGHADKGVHDVEDVN